MKVLKFLLVAIGKWYLGITSTVFKLKFYYLKFKYAIFVPEF